MRRLRRWRPGIWLLLEMIALCWPALLNNGHVIVFPDTHGYFVAGRNAVDKIAAVLHPATGHGAAGLTTAMQNARAARSAYYSVLTFLAADTVSLWLVVVVQAGVLTAILHLVYRLLDPMRPDRAPAFVIALGLGTTLSWLVSTAMPDVFAPVAVLLACALLLFWDDLTSFQRLLACFGVAAGCAMHLSNPPLVAGIACVAGLLRRRRLWAERARYAAVGCGIGLALAATLLVSIVAFRQISLTPNQPPFVLAHAVADGPGRLYLRKHCPAMHYEMCKYLDRLDVDAADFIWHRNGVYSTVPLDSAARIRDEEKTIFWHASLEYPLLTLATTARDAFEQLSDFTLQDFPVPSRARLADTKQEMPDNIVAAYSYQGERRRDLELWIRPSERVWQKLLAIPEYAVVLVSLISIAAAWRRGGLSRSDRQLVALIGATLVINALIVAFSDIAARYEARVAWLLPMAACGFALRAMPLRRRSPRQVSMQA